MKPKAKEIKEAAERSNLVIAGAIPVLDPVGLHDDDVFLSDSGWEVREDVEDHVTYEKANGTLRLTGGQSQEYEHRMNWELTIHANNTQIGYASIILRPGDMNGSTTAKLVREALEGGEAEFKKWSDALAEARRLLQA